MKMSIFIENCSVFARREHIDVVPKGCVLEFLRSTESVNKASETTRTHAHMKRKPRNQ